MINKVLIGLLLSFPIIAAANHSGDRQDEVDAIIRLFKGLFVGVENVSITISSNSNEHGFGIITSGVNQPTKQMCEMFTAVAPTLGYVIVEHKGLNGRIYQSYRHCEH